MPQKLLIVESPNKIRKIKSFLGPDWDVKASVGHISDLAIKDGFDGLGIKDTKTFEPIWRIARDKKAVVATLKKAVTYASKVYLAMDPDREGEAIANQLIQVLKLKSFERIAFNEISKKAVAEAIAHPVGLDQGLVEAQETRRIIDRLYGFKGSQTIRNFNPNLVSVGRVQSAGLKIVVDRENEIKAFVARKYREPMIEVKQVQFQIKMKQEEIINTDWATFKVPATVTINVLEKEVKKINPPKPLSTSSALKLGASLGLKTKETSKLLQSLFEKGLISYIRTDSTNLSKDFKLEAKSYIEKELGYVTDITRTYKLAKGAQEGHEAIRPVHIEDEGTSITNIKERNMYESIRQITIASLLESGENDLQKMEIKVGDHIFENRVISIKKMGYRDYLPSKAIDNLHSETLEAKKEYPTKLILKAKTTAAPPRYSESSFLSKIEKEGIGRPSTYSTMLSTVQERSYVVVKDRQLIPTIDGHNVIKFLTRFFPKFIEISFTGEMEANLDKISHEKMLKIDVLRDFWKKLNSYFTSAQNATAIFFKKKYGSCPKCKSYLRPVSGKYGSFYGCSNYPSCKFIKKLH